jgi:hypothetical protein
MISLEQQQQQQQQQAALHVKWHRGQRLVHEKAQYCQLW